MSANLKDYVTLGRSGLRVSPLCLGTMTFGPEWGWGVNEDASRAVFDRYVDAGGNFLDTADGYTAGTSETLLGKFVRDRGVRDRMVIATKFTFNADPGNPNAGGNGRKNIYRALTGSLRRLQTDYIDLYWLHCWDMVTPIEEVVSTFDDLVREGKIRHYGFSDTPAWYLARAQTLAEREGKECMVALQLEYSLLERHIEHEHIPAAQELGMAICPWSPLAGGFLSGKYEREGTKGRGEGRLTKDPNNPVFQRFVERNWHILGAVRDIANELQRTPAQIALNWVATQPGITSTIIGATSIPQLDDNLAALSFTIPERLRTRLDEVSALEPVHPYMFFGAAIQERIRGGVPLHRWTPAEVTGGPALARSA